jgi:lipid A 3-O-deacylase
MRKILPFFLFFLLAINVEAQEAISPDERAFNFFYANDVTGQTDKYYTNGVRFDLTLPVLAKSPFSLSWLRWQEGITSYHSLNFKYDVFTPDLNKDLFSDRPFAAVMMLGSRHQFIWPGNKLMLTSELAFGIIGQATGAGKLQNGLHKIMPGADSVIGWETQVRNDIALNYVFSVDKQVHRSDFAEIILGGTAYLGSPYTKLESRVLLRIGLMEDYFNLLNSNPQRNWQVYIYGDFKAAYVAYNATLNGGPLNPNNPYVLTAIEPFILDLEGGVGITYKAYSLTYGQHLITPEFSGADLYMWGELNFMVTF